MANPPDENRPKGQDQKSELPDGLQLPAEVGAGLRARIEKATAGIISERGQRKQVIDRVTKEVIDELQHVTITAAMETKVRTGPLPAPEDLAAYEEIEPGTAKRIIAMAEKDQDAYIAAHGDRSAKDQNYRMWGLAAGFGSLIVIVAAATLLGMYGHTSVAVAVAGVGLVGVVSAFINGRFSSGED